MRLFALSLIALLPACVSMAADGITGTEWHLVGIEGQPAPARLSLVIGEDGKLSGQAPCNRWFGALTSPLSAFAPKGIGATRMACADLEAEQVYFESLAAMQRVELAEGRLMLIGAEGRVMEFAAEPSAKCLSCGG